jgi:hypothetical protein
VSWSVCASAVGARGHPLSRKVPPAAKEGAEAPKGLRHAFGVSKALYRPISTWLGHAALETTFYGDVASPEERESVHGQLLDELPMQSTLHTVPLHSRIASPFCLTDSWPTRGGRFPAASACGRNSSRGDRLARKARVKSAHSFGIQRESWRASNCQTLFGGVPKQPSRAQPSHGICSFS